MDSPEYKSILECKSRLITALKADPQSVITDLEAKGLIPNGCISSSDHSKVDQARQAVYLIMDRLQNSPREFLDILDVFSKHQWLKTGVKILQDKYGKRSYLVLGAGS